MNFTGQLTCPYRDDSNNSNNLNNEDAVLSAH